MILSLLLSIFLQQTVKPEGLTRPNVLIVILDDVGKYDTDRVDVPTIDMLAAGGRNFIRGYAMPVCAPARATLMYGIYDESLGPTCSNTPSSETPDTNAFSLANLFNDRGYNTAMFGKWHLGTNNVGMPWQMTPELEGFDSVFAMIPGNVSAECDGFEGDYYNWLAVENGVSYVENRYHTLVMRDKFMDWWSQTRGPKFAYVAFQAAHAPFDEPPLELLPYLPQGGPGNRTAYEKLIVTIDFTLSQMLSVVDIKSTYIIVIGDNGTPPNATTLEQDRNKVKTTPYEGGIHVPFIIYGPGIIPGDTDALATVADILPTLSDLLGLDATIDGVSLLPILKNPAVDVHDHIFASNAGDRAIVQDRYKLIRLQSIERFFDLQNDPNETRPLNPLNMDPGIVATLRKQMNGYIHRGL
jgi:arylsulfatase A-like enzyme